jgi:alpha-glucosidase (family GH31 glycosyl hydrolase)
MTDPAARSLQLHHVPLGIEDPYTVQPWERYPREPREGDAVTVSAVTRPPGAVSGVTVEVAPSEGSQFSVSALHAPYEGEGDRWEAMLGHFRAGTTVTYRLTASASDGEIARVGPFAFEPAKWHDLTRITTWEALHGGLRATLSDRNGTLSTLCLEAIAPDVLRLRLWPLAPETPPQAPEGLPFTTTEENGKVVVAPTNLRVELGIDDATLAIEWPDAAGGVTRLSTGCAGLAWLDAGDDHPHAVRLRLSLVDDEGLYATGERFDQFDRRGQRFDFRVYEQYKEQRARTYLPMPLLISSRGYALSVAGTRPFQMDAGAGASDVLEVTAEVSRRASACLEALIVVSKSPLEALQSYLQHTGLPVLPPDWAFGLWMSANDWNSQERVLAEVDRGVHEGVPGGVVVIEAWSDEETFYIWNDAQYRPVPAGRPPCLADFHFPGTGRWPDPKALIDELHRRGLRVVLWQIPLVKNPDEPHPQRSLDVEAIVRNRWCTLDAEGEPYRNPGWWFPGALLPDLTNPEALDWWLSRRRYLVEELGVDGFKTDGGEHIWGRDVQFADGRGGDEMINAFPVLYAAAYHRLLRDCGREDGLTFSRAGYAGSQRYPAHWAGDENSTWDAFRHSIIAGLSAAASGIPFWGWDIAGFSGEIPSGELYRRAWMMAAFCPIMQYHSEYNARREPSRDRTPWNIAERTGDPEVLPACRRYAQVRKWLLPYIAREARHTAATGRPVMCALCLAFSEDPACRVYPYQYLFGRDLLVAPTVEEGASFQRVYLPAGTWRDLWSERLFMGPAEVSVAVPPDHIPVFVRSGAASPLDRPFES